MIFHHYSNAYIQWFEIFVLSYFHSLSLSLRHHRSNSYDRKIEVAMRQERWRQQIKCVPFFLYHFRDLNRKTLFFFQHEMSTWVSFRSKEESPGNGMEQKCCVWWDMHIVHVRFTSGISWNENNKQYEIKIP